MSFIVKLKIIDESEKGYQLEDRTWFPKKAFSKEGLEEPYFKIEEWFIKLLYKQRDKPKIQSLQKILVEWQDVPIEVRKNYTKYWKEQYESLYYDYYDYNDDRMQIGEWAYGIGD